jgi:hypothetical protein
MPPLDPATPDLTPAQRQIAAWALREAAPWRARGLNWKQAEPAYEKLAAGVTAVFLFRINKGNVTIEPKPSHADHPRLGWFMRRASMYRQHFQDAAESWCPDLETTLCVCVDDAPAPDPVFPTFSFQKRAQEAVILLPDIDFLVDDYYENLIFRDNLSFTHKRNRAFFIGSFTGGLFTAETVKSLSIPRLAAAAHFHNDPDVEFRMPLQGQIESPAVAKMLAALPYCGGETATWWEQRENRFLISMDGNGATCSRVVISLKSNCVLLKYDSPHRLYYFDGIAPWTHYIPIHAHDDVRHTVALERAAPGLLAHIPRYANAFVTTYLTRENVLFYTAAVLSQYAMCFAEAAPPQSGRAGPPTSPVWAVTAHVQMAGDVFAAASEWCGTPGSGLWIEGFNISVLTGPVGTMLEYRVTYPDGTLSPWTRAGQYCGTRGQAQPVAGLSLRLTGPAADLLDLSYEASFIDGSRIGPVGAGEICAAETRSALEAFRIKIEQRPSS